MFVQYGNGEVTQRALQWVAVTLWLVFEIILKVLTHNNLLSFKLVLDHSMKEDTERDSKDVKKDPPKKKKEKKRLIKNKN